MSAPEEKPEGSTPQTLDSVETAGPVEVHGEPERTAFADRADAAPRGQTDGNSLPPQLTLDAPAAPALSENGRAAVSAQREKPGYVFLGILAGTSLALDVGTKAWAEVTVTRRGFEPIEIIDHHLSITLAYNQGGAWGILSNAPEFLRKPFFLMVSAAAVWFIVSLYGRLHPTQRALTWGLPLVLGGALGNLSDRIVRSEVVDFIDYRADWVLHLNSFVHKYVSNWTLTDHWPTFNVADIAICIGVGLMAVDMFTSRRRQGETNTLRPSPVVPAAVGD